jgi:acetyltransferase
MGGRSVQDGIQLLDQHKIATARTPNEAVTGFANLVRYARTRDILYETPHEVPLDYPPARASLRTELQDVLSSAPDMLDASQAKSILSAYGIAVSRPWPAGSAEQAAPDAIIQAITVQPMVVQVGGIELMRGMKKDPIFGPVIMVGVGGSTSAP